MWLRHAKTKKKKAQMKEQIKALEKIQLSNEEIANLSNTQFQTLVIRMLQEFTGYFNSIKKTTAAMKVALCEIKKNLQGTNSDRKETGTQSTVWSKRKKETFNQNRVKKQEFKKNEERFRNLQDIFKHSNNRIIGLPEGEEENQEIENLLEKIVKENFPNLAKEIDFQEVQEAQRVPKKPDPRRNTPTHIITALPKIKEKERILKAAREKETVIYEGVPIRLSADFSKETLQARRGWQEVFQVMKGKDLQPRLVYPAKLSLTMEGQIKCFPAR